MAAFEMRADIFSFNCLFYQEGFGISSMSVRNLTGSLNTVSLILLNIRGRCWNCKLHPWDRVVNTHGSDAGMHHPAAEMLHGEVSDCRLLTANCVVSRPPPPAHRGMLTKCMAPLFPRLRAYRGQVPLIGRSACQRCLWKPQGPGRWN